MTAAHTTANAWRYGLLGLPLAFVTLPLYVSLPRHYADQYAVPLATLGALLLATRLLDALLDPVIGRWVDRLFARRPRRSWQLAALASVAMALGFAALWMPPSTTTGQADAVMLWLAAALTLTYLAYSVVSMVHQTWGARWGGQADERARLLAWREGASLAGLLLASALPAWLGLHASSVALALGLVLGLWALQQTLPAHGAALGAEASPSSTPGSAFSTTHPGPSPWSNRPFVALLWVFLLNGTAAAIPATLLPFFVHDTLQAPDWEPLFLGSYFLAAAAGLPLWVKLVRHWGLAPSWLLGMALSVAAFCSVPLLGPGDALAFEAICVLTGLALGADLAIPGAMLTGIIHQSGQGQQSEGHFFGWWTAATKLNLALASGLSLPLLAWLGFETGSRTADNQWALNLSYGLLPCALKLCAAAALWRAMHRHPVLKGHA